MPLEMPRVAPRTPQPYRAGTAAARPDIEESVQSNNENDGDEQTDFDTSDYSDDDRTRHYDDSEDEDAQDEDNGDFCCAPLSAMTKPVEVGELGSYGYAGEPAFWIWPLFGPLLFENTSSDVSSVWGALELAQRSLCPL